MTNPVIHIRQATAIDISLLTSIIRISFRDVADRFSLTPDNAPKHPSNCADNWIEKDLARGVIYYILESNGLSVGCAAIEQGSPEVCYLERLSVLPVERSKGFGRALVYKVFFKAKTLGAREVQIGIIAQHTELKEWYEKIGFRERETKDFAHLPFRVSFMDYRF
jgi:diamine N-acetyltransferase